MATQAASSSREQHKLQMLQMSLEEWGKVSWNDQFYQRWISDTITASLSKVYFIECQIWKMFLEDKALWSSKFGKHTFYKPIYNIY